MPSVYRVAAPSIRIVPWAALASCWPLPQQLLPVSAAGGGRRRCTLAIFSGKIIYNFANLENLRIFQICLFTGGVWNELPQSKPDGFASSLWEGANPLRLTPFASSPEGGAFCRLPVSTNKAPPFGGAGIAQR